MQETKKKKKKVPLTRGEVEIRQKMTVEELAQAMGKDIGETQPALGTETATSATPPTPVGKAGMASGASEVVDPSLGNPLGPSYPCGSQGLSYSRRKMLHPGSSELDPCELRTRG